VSPWRPCSPPGAGWRRAGLVALGAAVPALLLRVVALGGIGGYSALGPEPAGAWGAGLRVLDRAEMLGYVGTNLLAVAALGLVAWTVRRRRAALWAVAFTAGHLLLATAAGGVASWYLYAPTVGWIGILATAATGPRPARVAAAGFATLALLGSPAWTDYPEWRLSSDLTRRWIDATREARARTEGPLVLAGIPFAIQVEASRPHAARSAVALRDLTLESALELEGIVANLEGVAKVHLRNLDADYRVDATPTPHGWRLSTREGVDLHPPVGVDWSQRDGTWVGPTGWRVRRAGRELEIQPGPGTLWVWSGDGLRRVPPAGSPPR